MFEPLHSDQQPYEQPISTLPRPNPFAEVRSRKQAALTLKAALYLGAGGSPVFPCRATRDNAKGKWLRTPVTPGGWEGASCDLDTIREWFTGTDYVIGQRPAEMGICVLNLAVGVEVPDLPLTYTVRTPSGGRHFYFKNDLALACDDLAPGIDVPDYVIVPPSPGYAILDSREPVQLPNWVVERLGGFSVVEPRKESLTPDAGAKASRRPTGLAICMADVEPEEVEWLWHPYIPRGKLTSIEGDPGVGKSWLTMALAAQVSRGQKLPGMKQAADPAPVLLLTAEDGPADTIRPRLDAAGADVSKVHVISGPLALDENAVAKLKAEIEELEPALVIIDPIVAYLPEKTDINSASAVRPILARLAQVAEQTRTAIAFVRHLAKGTRDKAIYRGLGSIDFTAACRSVLMVGFDPQDASKRIVAHAKSNLSAPGLSLAYTLKGGFAWAGRSSLSAEDLGAPPPDADQRSAREEARDFLFQTLAEGPKPQHEIQAEASKHGISVPTLRRAKTDLGVKAVKKADHWEWSLPTCPHQVGKDQGAHTSGDDHLEHLDQSKEYFFL